MDFNMLALNGAKTTAIIRSMTALTHAQLPIIGFTTDTSKDTVALCLMAGMNKVVKKPAPKSVLESELKTAFQTRDAAILTQIAETGEPIECLSGLGDNIESQLETIEKIDKESHDKDSERIAPRADNVSYLVNISDPSATESKTAVTTDVHAMINAYLEKDNSKQ
jgi:CheY-like chemotaxis protein